MPLSDYELVRNKAYRPFSPSVALTIDVAFGILSSREQLKTFIVFPDSGIREVLPCWPPLTLPKIIRMAWWLFQYVS